MQAPTPPKGLSHRWRRAWPVGCLLVALTLILLIRSRPVTSPVTTSAKGATEGRAPGYQNRAQLRRAEALADEAPSTPAIRGTIYDMEGAVVEGAVVSAATFQIAGNVPTTAGSVESDAQGRFELRLPDGSYYLNGGKEGYGPAIVIAHSGDDIGIVLPRSGVVLGHVYDERHEPVKRFTIDVLPLARDNMPAPAPLWSQRFDSPDGSFRIDRLPRTPSFLRATAEGHAASFSPTLNVEPGKTRELDLTLASGCTLIGTAVDEQGRPAPSVFVDAEARRVAGMMGNASIDAASQAETDMEGRFRLEHVSRGEVLVRGYDGSHAVTTVAVQVADCDAQEPIKLTMSSGGVVTGVVRRGDGTPLPGAKLALSHRSIGYLHTLSDAEGRYRFDQLPANLLRLEVQESGHHTMVSVLVKDGESVEKDIALVGEGQGEIRGRITAGGKPLRGVQIHVATALAASTMDIHFPTTDEDGTYRVTGLAEGAYLLVVSSTFRTAVANVEAGQVVTADIDVAATPERLAAAPPPAEGSN